MASVWQLLLWSGLCVSSVSMNLQLIKVQPKQAVSGVFEASLRNTYALNASAARDVCERLGVTIASKAQVEAALKHGLETCRFGWVDEQIAVVPRLHMKSNCGNGNVGLVVWRADLSRGFDVFCFNSTDFEIQNQASMTADRSSTQMPKRTPPKSSASSPLRSSSVPYTLSPSPILIYTEDREKHLAVSDRPASGAVPVALLITVSFVVLLAVFLAPYYSKINRTCRRPCDGKQQQQENIETQVCDLQKSQEQNSDLQEEENSSSCSSDQH